MTRSPLVSIVIPSLDAGEMLTECLAALRAEREEIEVIVVDNASSDGSVDEAQRRFPATIVVRNDTNRGYAPACNHGAARASSEFVLFLNNDATLAPAELDRLLTAARSEPNTAIWQPVTYGVDGTLESTGDFFTWWGIFQHLAAVPESQPTAEVFSTVGAAMLVRRSAFDEIGRFQDSYFAYYEESDLCWRARLAGWDVHVVTTARVTHVGSETTGRIFEPHAVRYLAFRNRIRTILANASRRSLWRLIPQHALACLGFVGLYAITGRWRSARAVLSAMIWPFGHREVIREQRAAVQATRTRRDAEVFRDDLVASFGPLSLARHLRRAYWFEEASDRGFVSDKTRNS